jgi:hypothetical protein
MSWRNSGARLWGVLVSSVTAIGLMLAPFTPTSASAATVQVSKPDASLTATWWEKIMAIPGDSLGRCDVGTGKSCFWLERPEDPLFEAARPIRTSFWCR